MFPRSGGEKVYLEAVYKHPRFLATVVFATQAVLLGFTGEGVLFCWLHPGQKLSSERSRPDNPYSIRLYHICPEHSGCS